MSKCLCLDSKGHDRADFGDTNKIRLTCLFQLVPGRQRMLFILNINGTSNANYTLLCIIFAPVSV